MSISKEAVRSFRCPRFCDLPTLSLYMDQVLIVLEETLSPFSGSADVATTSTMINNYVKLKVIAPPEKKKYSREHVAKLMMICVLKRELSITEICELFELITVKRSIGEAYDLFCEYLESTLHAFFSDTPADSFLSQLFGNTAESALEAALTAFSGKLLVQSILEENRLQTVKHTDKSVK